MNFLSRICNWRPLKSEASCDFCFSYGAHSHLFICTYCMNIRCKPVFDVQCRCFSNMFTILQVIDVCSLRKNVEQKFGFNNIDNTIYKTKSVRFFSLSSDMPLKFLRHSPPHLSLILIHLLMTMCLDNYDEFVAAFFYH